jgi:protein phosphatase
VIVRATAGQPAVAVAEAVAPAAETEGDPGEQLLPDFEGLPAAAVATTEAVLPESVWPSIAWEHARLERAPHPSLPRVLDRVTIGDFEYLVEEVPTGRPLWDAWDDPESTADHRFGWLRQVAEAMRELHQAGAIFESLRPDRVVVTPDNCARFTDLYDLLPLQMPPDTPVRDSLFTAPELVLARETADARADLYGFGALLYALHMGRELAEADFEFPGSPKPFISLFPDAHPALARLISKTFCRDISRRFPTEEASRQDPTGLTELIQTLEVCRHALGQVRLDVASWTTTGMIRSGNEDAFAVLHGAAARQDGLEDTVLVLLADGMGGYEAGEVAAALAVQELRRHLLQRSAFIGLTDDPAFWPDPLAPGSPPPAPFDVEACRALVDAALKEANNLVYNSARSGIGKRGMGCTAEVVCVRDRHLVVGHVGDSRTYHLSRGELVQVTRDQTLVNRLVELGHLTEEEAETHPRRSELQQAIGGHSDVEPSVYHRTLSPGDWVVVCSDGLSNHIPPDLLPEVLQASFSAESAARRLVNLANLAGATDNATVVVVRAT